MSSGPKISVLTPVFNCARYLPRCIESVLAQGYQLSEHIVVDGGSQDGTVDLLKSHPHLTWISEPDTGEANALNKAIKLATGDLLVWLNGDDWLEPGAFDAVLRAHSDNPQLGVFYGPVRMVGEASKKSFIKSPLSSLGMPELIRWWYTDRHPHQPGMYFSRDALNKAGFFDETLHFSIDYEYWLRLARHSLFGYVDHILANALLRAECKSAGTEVEQIKSHWNVLLPYVHSLPSEDQETYWRDYYSHRLTNPLIFEQTRMPTDSPAVDGLVKVLTERAPSEIESRFISLFPDPDDQALVTNLLERSAIRHRRPPAPQKRVKVAEDYAGSLDLTKVSQESEFARGIREVFSRHRPTKIIETGTYLGTGTTAVIASTLRDLQVNDAIFYSIEVNPRNVTQAEDNLRSAGLDSYVKVRHGLSVPRNILPTVQQIEESCVRNVEGDDIFVDHREHNRAALYHQETECDGAEEDLLGKALTEFDNKPDFVILDSAGHMGFVEFSYLLENLQGRCIIALDDVYHIKHHRSFELVKRDPRFKVVFESREKFGFCIAEFSPSVTLPALEVEGGIINSGHSDLPHTVSRILFIRTDAIGDSVLASSLLEPIMNYYPKAECAVVCHTRVAPLYDASPFVSKVFAYGKNITNEAVNALKESIQTWAPDLVINSAFSRDKQSDCIAAWPTTPHKVAFEGDTLNTRGGYQPAGSELYSLIVRNVDSWTPELKKYDALLQSLGIRATPRTPMIWRDQSAEEFADELFRIHNIPQDKAIAFAPIARVDDRLYPRFAETIAMLAERGYFIIGLGDENQDAQVKRACGINPLPYLSLCGRTSLVETASVIARCKLFIGAESAPAHIACAVGTPNVVILGGGHFGRFMPYTPLTSIVSVPVSCTGCNWKCSFEVASCVKDVDPLVVRQAVEDRLEIPNRERIQIYLSIPHVAQRGLRVYPSIEPDLEKFSELGDVIVMREGEDKRVMTCLSGPPLKMRPLDLITN